MKEVQSKELNAEREIDRQQETALVVVEGETEREI